MDYQLQFRKFISSQYLYQGLRISAGVLIPAFILYQFGLLTKMIALPLGALFISLTDTPGPINNRRNGMLLAILLGFVALIVASYSRDQPILIIVEIIVFGLILTLIGVFGTRANSIGLTTLLIYIINVDQPKSGNPWLLATYFAAGGLWYALLSLVLYTIRPYRPIQQMLGECIMEVAEYLEAKELFYETERNTSSIYQHLMQYQVRIHNHFDQIRQSLFSARKFLSESTVKGRTLMMMFLETIDLMERAMTSQQDYELLHKEFDQSGILKKYGDLIRLLANELKNIGLAVQSNVSYKASPNTESTLDETTTAFFQLREQKLSEDNIEGFIRLRQILYSLQDLTERVTRMASYTTFDKRLSKRHFKEDIESERFISPERVNLRLLLSNFSIKSDIFRHALRLVIGLLTGYIISLLFPLGHGYWIMLTIAVILKPAYSISRQRNISRVIGTLIGAMIGFTVLYFTSHNGPLFIIMLIAMIIGYSFLKLNYGVASAGITVFVLLNFHFLSPAGIQPVLRDRVLDTAIGSAVAWLVSAFILPTWEHEKIDEYILEALKANRKYFNEVAKAFMKAELNMSTYRLSRKEAFVALANLSDNFQRMISEPKSQQRHMEEYHQFVATNHMLTSYIASLAYYSQRQSSYRPSHNFSLLIEHGDRLFDEAISIIEKNEPAEIGSVSLPVPPEVNELLQKRKHDLASGIDSGSLEERKKLSELKTIVEQYQLVYSNLQEQVKILQQIKGINKPSLKKVEQS
jgi:uncharacterized membrane protein (TIGR01666 family)